SNKLYSIVNTTMDVIRHPVKIGAKYTMVFLANEPSDTYFQSISKLSDLNAIAYPAAAFASNKVIPMMQVIEGVEVQANGTVKLTQGTRIDINGKERTITAEGLYDPDTETDKLILRLDRLAVRLHVTLQSGFAMGTDFKGITLSNMPDVVPLFQGAYTGAITNSIERSYVASEFSTVTVSGTDWARQLDRIVIPANYLPNKTDNAKATKLTVNLPDDKYSPDCELRILDDNYNLPYNTWLEFTGTIKKPLEVNIKAKDWTDVSNNWQIAGSRVLNVSQTTASITDLNGVRISFYSNMPRVRVLEACKKNGEDKITNTEFNDLATPTLNADGTYSTTRFYYNPNTGEGYMDVLVDGGFNDLAPDNQTGTYTLTLSADNGNGGSALNREITVNVTQEGYRFKEGNWAGNKQYLGVFFRNEELGERVITGQMNLYDDAWGAVVEENRGWEVTVPEKYKDWIVLSSTPSFDPKIGTEDPGDPENYPVIPNSYKGEDGSKVKGRGRLYFRIGMKKPNTTVADGDGLVKPNYFYVELKYNPTLGSTWRYTQKIYIRQGEDADYLFEKTEVIGQKDSGAYQPLIGKTRTAAARFSPYNLTAQEFNNGSNNTYVQLAVNGGKFVEYPSQTGAYFHWGLRIFPEGTTEASNIQKFYRRAMHPDNSGVKSNDVLISKKRNNTTLYPSGYAGYWYNLWNEKVDAGQNGTSTFVGPYKDVFETCPPGYRRPTDGPTDKYTANGLTPTTDTSLNPTDESGLIADSEFRVSLFTYPYSGDSNSNSDLKTIWDNTTGPGTYPTGDGWDKTVVNTANTLYADGFFDRRPIKKTTNNGYGVALGTSKVAYVGTLFVHPTSYASIFFPLSGRIDNDWGDYLGRGTTGYYWGSSASPVREGNDYMNTIGTTSYDRRSTNGAWSFEIQYNFLKPKSTYADFAEAIRCVKE
ncbi:hypothetical protein LJB79_00565, partial [Bacteroides sp. OttesenSCG-928-M17]|nr:hypothetical protein [Bacteroides sp. OttesenSCG-928-M17]